MKGDCKRNRLLPKPIENREVSLSLEKRKRLQPAPGERRTLAPPKFPPEAGERSSHPCPSAGSHSLTFPVLLTTPLSGQARGALPWLGTRTKVTSLQLEKLFNL